MNAHPRIKSPPELKERLFLTLTPRPKELVVRPETLRAPFGYIQAVPNHLFKGVARPGGSG